jgi:hypothetical protein
MLRALLDRREEFVTVSSTRGRREFEPHEGVRQFGWLVVVSSRRINDLSYSAGHLLPLYGSLACFHKPVEAPSSSASAQLHVDTTHCMCIGVAAYAYLAYLFLPSPTIHV